MRHLLKSLGTENKAMNNNERKGRQNREEKGELECHFLPIGSKMFAEIRNSSHKYICVQIALEIEKPIVMCAFGGSLQIDGVLQRHLGLLSRKIAKSAE